MWITPENRSVFTFSTGFRWLGTTSARARCITVVMGRAEMLLRQDGRCGICKTRPYKKSLVEDHDPKIGLRGLVCEWCQFRLGLLESGRFRINEFDRWITEAHLYLQRSVTDPIVGVRDDERARYGNMDSEQARCFPRINTPCGKEVAD